MTGANRLLINESPYFTDKCRDKNRKFSMTNTNEEYMYTYIKIKQIQTISQNMTSKNGMNLKYYLSKKYNYKNKT